MRGTELVINLSDGVATLVQFERGSGSRSVARRVALVLPEGLDAAATASHVASLAAEADMASEWTGLVLDGAGVLVRDFAFPFSAPAKVERAVRFEMDGGLPCDAAELAGGVLMERVGKGCRVFSFSLRREALGGLLAALAENGQDPALAGIDLAALGSFAERLPAGVGPVCLVDVGFGRTLVAALGEDGVLALARRECGVGRVLDGCDDFTRQDLLDGGIPAGLPAGALTEAADAIERAVRQVALGCGVTPRALCLCGVGAALPGLAQALADRAGVEVDSVWSLADPESMGLAEAADPLAVGVLEQPGLLGARRGAAMNLRRGEFARNGDARGALKRYSWVGAMALLLLLAWGASFVAGAVQQGRAVRAVEERVDALFRKTVPDAAGDFRRAQMFSILKTRIDRLQGRKEEGDQRARVSCLEIVRAVNAAAPAKLDVDVDALTVGDRGGHVRGTARDFQAVNTFLEGLAKGGVLADVRIVVASAVKKTGRVRFELEYTRN